MSFDPYDTLVTLTHGFGVMASLAAAFGIAERGLAGVYLRSSVHGLLFGPGAILVMLEPVRFENGLAYDARAIIVGIAGAFAGGPAALIAAAIGCVDRLHIEGLGASAGAAGIVLTAALGLIRARMFRPESGVGLRALSGLGAMLALYTLNVFLLPPSVIWMVLTAVGPVLAVSCIASAIVMGSLIERERLYIRREGYWKDSACTDAMTELPNRRWVQDVLAALPGQRRRSATDALLMVDADDSKAVNDCYGHQAGDAARVHIAGILQSETRVGDRVCRLGGEAFAVFVFDTTPETAARRASDLRRAVSEATLTYDRDVVPPSVGNGAAARTGFAEAQPADLVRTADAALHTAEKGGRNRVVVANASEPARGRRVTGVRANHDRIPSVWVRYSTLQRAKSPEGGNRRLRSISLHQIDFKPLNRFDGIEPSLDRTQESPFMTQLSFYAALDRAGLRNYRAKIMVVAFIGTHIPLIASLAYVAAQNAADWVAFARILGVTLAATLVGTGITLAMLHQLLKPLSLTARALRLFRTDRTLSPLPHGFTDEAGMLMSDAAETMIHLDRAMDLLEHVDEVTNLPNRKRMLGLIDEHVRVASPFAVAVIRFTDRGRIAETLDLARAQEATSLMAMRLRDAAEQVDRRSDAVVGILSESEFVLLLPGMNDAASVTETLLRMGREAGIEMAITDMRLHPVIATGAALFPTDGADATALLDYAMAAAAQAGPASPVVLHSTTARAAAIDRYRMEQDLGTALARDQLELYYQPVVDLSAGRVVGSEALVRWHHPDRGMILPDVFIPVAEASGLIDEIGAWIMKDACRQLGVWSAAGRDLHVAVNLSARQLADPRLHARTREAIDSSGIDPSRLEVELTETAAMADHDHSRQVFGALRDLGLGIAIDDFGTGYASLSTLRTLPFTKLKIDREFVTDVHRTPASQAICEALLALSRGLDLRVLAEGTETDKEVRFLHDRGCSLFQGYHFARPMPVAAFGIAVDRINLDLRRSAAVTVRPR